MVIGWYKKNANTCKKMFIPVNIFLFIWSLETQEKFQKRSGWEGTSTQELAKVAYTTFFLFFIQFFLAIPSGTTDPITPCSLGAWIVPHACKASSLTPCTVSVPYSQCSLVVVFSGLIFHHFFFCTNHLTAKNICYSWPFSDVSCSFLNLYRFWFCNSLLFNKCLKYHLFARMWTDFKFALPSNEFIIVYFYSFSYLLFCTAL